MAQQPTVVILAGGENSRFFPLNTQMHKGALTLLGKPLIVRTIENLVSSGFSHIVIVVSPKDHDGKGLSGFLSSYPTKAHIEFILQSQPKGMGDALLCAKDVIKGDFGIVFPSSLDGGDVLHRLMQKTSDGGAIAVTYTMEPWLYGIVTLDGDRITSIVEKPLQGTEPSNLKAQGVYYISHSYLSVLEHQQSEEYSFEKALDVFLHEHHVHAVELTHVLPSLKYPWHLFEFQQTLFAMQRGEISNRARVAPTVVFDETNGPIVVEDGAHIGHASRIVGPTYIGKNASIGDFSLVRSSSMEEGSSVGAYSEVTRSIVMERSSLHNGFLGDSIVGKNVQIGAGFITSNKRMDRKNIHVLVKDTKVDRGTNALGTVIGDGAKIGIRVNVMPGKFIGSQSVLYPTVTVYKHVAHDEVVKE